MTEKNLRNMHKTKEWKGKFIEGIYLDWNLWKSRIEGEGWHFNFYLLPNIQIEHSENDVIGKHCFLGLTTLRISWLFLSLEITHRNHGSNNTSD